MDREISDIDSVSYKLNKTHDCKWWVVEILTGTQGSRSSYIWSQCIDAAAALNVKRDDYRNVAKSYGAVCRRCKMHRNRPAKHRMVFSNREDAYLFATEWVQATIMARKLAKSV